MKIINYKKLQDIKTWSKSRWNNERDDLCNKSDYIMINLICSHMVSIDCGTVLIVLFDN